MPAAISSFTLSLLDTKLNDSSGPKKILVSTVELVITVLLDWFLLSAEPLAVAIAAAPATAAAPTVNCAKGLVIVPACFPTSSMPSFAMPFNSSLTSDFLIFFALLYVFDADSMAPKIFPDCTFLITDPMPSTIPPGPNMLFVPPPKTVNGLGELS